MIMYSCSPALSYLLPVCSVHSSLDCGLMVFVHHHFRKPALSDLFFLSVCFTGVIW